MPEIYELGPDDFCRSCSGTGSKNDEECWDCRGKGHQMLHIKRNFLDKGHSAVCVHEGKVIGYRERVGASEECGCPEEDWIVLNIEATIHFEEDGSGDILLYAGDWEDQIPVPAPITFDALRKRMFEHVLNLGEEA